jgi:hypothetical protein
VSKASIAAAAIARRSTAPEKTCCVSGIVRPAAHYNRYPKPAVVFVADGKADLVVRRETFEEMAAFDVVPERFQAKAHSK